MKKISFLIIFCLSFIVAHYSVNAKKMTRSDAALYLAQKLNIEHTNDPKTLYGLAYKVFPGDYIDNTDVTSYNKKMTLEVLIVTLVRYAGWNTIEYDSSKVTFVKKFVSKEGYPYYSPDPTPRSIPYIIVALDNGLLKKDELINLKKEITYKNIDTYIERLNNTSKNNKYENQIIIPKNEDINSLKNEVGKLVVLNKGIDNNEYLKNGNNTILDLRTSGIRLYRGDTKISNDRQDYFPLGPLETVLSVGLDVDKNNYSHQSEAIYGTINNYSKTSNAVAIWGNAQSSNKGARVWGGFINVLNKEKNDAQLIGMEIDVENTAENGVSPNESKVGLQVVSLGNKTSTSAVEVLAAGDGTGWEHGIIFGENSITKNGTMIGSSAKKAQIGMDFSNTYFSDSAILINNDSKISFKSKSGNSKPSIFTDKIDNGYLVIQSDEGGIRFVNKDNNVNILTLRNDGTIDENCEFYKKYIGSSSLTKYEIKHVRKDIYIIILIVSILFTLGIILIYSNSRKIRQYEARLKELENYIK